jgi:hypothetical protein
MRAGHVVHSARNAAGVHNHAENEKRYVAMLRVLLEDEQITDEERFMLKQFRNTWEIDADDEERALESIGWTLHEFLQGYRGRSLSRRKTSSHSVLVSFSDPSPEPDAVDEETKDALPSVPALPLSGDGDGDGDGGAGDGDGGAGVATHTSAAAVFKAARFTAATQVEVQKTKAQERMENVKEILVYCVFMLVFSLSIKEDVMSSTPFVFTDSLRATLIDDSGLGDVRTKEGLSAWLTGGFATAPAAEPFRSGEWHVVGPVRVAQLRANRQDCTKTQPSAWGSGFKQSNASPPGSGRFVCYGDDSNTWTRQHENTSSFRGFEFDANLGVYADVGVKGAREVRPTLMMTPYT